MQQLESHPPVNVSLSPQAVWLCQTLAPYFEFPPLPRAWAHLPTSLLS